MKIKNLKAACQVATVLLILGSCEKDSAPVAQFSTNPLSGDILTLFTFDATLSHDDKDGISGLLFRWDFNSDGTWDTEFAFDTVMTYRFPSAAEYTVTLEVMDSKGHTGTVEKKVSVAAGNFETFTDPRDGNVYPYVTIGTDTWMARNLAYLPFVIPQSRFADDSDFLVFNFDQGYDVPAAKATAAYQTYGALYCSQRMEGYDYCPEGWHTATIEDWTTLINFLGGDKVAGKKLKSTSGWSPRRDYGGNPCPNMDGNGDNSSGFSALPGGYMFPINNIRGAHCLFMSYSAFFLAKCDTTQGSLVRIDNIKTREDCTGGDEVYVYPYTYAQLGAYSVRCVKDK